MASGSDGVWRLVDVTPFSSRATGVGHMRIASVSDVPGCITPVVVVPLAALAASVVTGVGHCNEEETLSSMRSSDVRGCDDAPVHDVTKPFEVPDNTVQPSRNECRNVLDDDEARAQFTDDAGVLAPES